MREDDAYDWLDECTECTGYGDDYFINEKGELECRCPTCPFNTINFEDYDDD